MADVSVVALRRFNDGRQWRERSEAWTCELPLAQRFQRAGHVRIETAAAKVDYNDKAAAPALEDMGARSFMPPWRRQTSDEEEVDPDGDEEEVDDDE